MDISTFLVRVKLNTSHNLTPILDYKDFLKIRILEYRSIENQLRTNLKFHKFAHAGFCCI